MDKAPAVYSHEIISNKTSKMSSVILKNLHSCDEFYFCIAFVGMSGVQILKKTLLELEEKGIKGKIVTGNYLNFSDPFAISELDKFSNINVKFNYNDELHAKGYFFRKGNEWTIIVGSSNLTATALTKNLEWNLVVNSKNDYSLVRDAIYNFDKIFDESINFAKIYPFYLDEYILKKQQHLNFKNAVLSSKDIVPNNMQKEALSQLKKLRDTDKKKAILISATGSGKTYLSAMDVKAFGVKRCLFIVHRETIIDKSIESFFDILKGNKDDFGIFDGRVKESTKNYIFANISTLAKDKYLTSFEPDYFDYIIVDEVHKSGAASYTKVLDYFTPKFLLGMTATPYRNDDFNIFNLFDNNIAYEIRMKDAINEGLIVPFHYYGVTEIFFNNKQATEKDLIKLDIKLRVQNLLDKSLCYGFSGDKVRGLIFVGSKEEAHLIANEINNQGFRAIYLTGEDNSNKRHSAIKNIALKKDHPNYLDYIVSVDIFNEGVDIPFINQVLLLRPTQSSIIYIQQIGRGLRKSLEKSFLVIIDFIGNYKNNFLIPVALTGNNTYDIDAIKNIVIESSTFAPDCCSIEFEYIPQKNILENITKEFKKLTAVRTIFMSDYKQLKQRLNRIPLLNDFYKHQLLSPAHILKLKNKTPYWNLVKELENKDVFPLSLSAELFLKFIYSEFSLSKRVHEIAILNELLNIKEPLSISELNIKIENILGQHEQIKNTVNAMEHLEFKLFRKDNIRKQLINDFDKNEITFIKKVEENYYLSEEFLKSYNNELFFKILLDDIIDLNLNIALTEYVQLTTSTLKLFADYDRREIFHLLNMDYHPGFQVGGYVENKTANSVIIFVKLDRSSYANEFLENQTEFIWMSKKGKSLISKDTSILEKDIASNKKTLLIFMKKEEGEKSYFVGQAEVIKAEDAIIKEAINIDGKDMVDKKIIKYKLRLLENIPDYLFTYLTSSEG